MDARGVASFTPVSLPNKIFIIFIVWYETIYIIILFKDKYKLFGILY